MTKKFKNEADRIIMTYGCITAGTMSSCISPNPTNHISIHVGNVKFTCSEMSDLKDLEDFCKLKENK